MYIASLLIKLRPILVSCQCCHGDDTRKLHTSRNINSSMVPVSDLNRVGEVGGYSLLYTCIINCVESGYLSVITGRIPYLLKWWLWRSELFITSFKSLHRTTWNLLCVLLESIIVVRAVTRSYYRGAAGALLVYDISSRDSYNAISSWLSDARTLASPNIIVILVGNKKDLDAEREVTFMEATRFAQENG